MNVEIKSFKEIFPSLLSIVEDIPANVLVSFSMTDATLKSRNKYLESTINRLNNISKFTSRYLKAHPTELPFFDLVLELSNWIDKEQRVRLAIRRLVNNWFYKKYSKRCLNENDPWTLYPPTNPIVIFDSKCRGYYQFEANSLKLHIEKSLEYSQWLFPTPYAPKNPLTNLPFHDGQLSIILSGLRKQGYGSWKIEAYKASNYNNELISLMNFGELRKSLGQRSQQGSYELLRFCNKLNTTVIGGASKLFRYFINNYNPKEIISYADRSISNGSMYLKLGFNLSHISDPNYYYVINKIRYHRFNFRKDKLVKDGYESTLSESDIMAKLNIYKIYNSGNLKFVFSS